MDKKGRYRQTETNERETGGETGTGKENSKTIWCQLNMDKKALFIHTTKWHFCCLSNIFINRQIKIRLLWSKLRFCSKKSNLFFSSDFKETQHAGLGYSKVSWSRDKWNSNFALLWHITASETTTTITIIVFIICISIVKNNKQHYHSNSVQSSKSLKVRKKKFSQRYVVQDMT